ncbi:rubredoxin [Escherichia coli]
MRQKASQCKHRQVPDNFLCPECSLGKDVFDELASEAKSVTAL